MENVYQSLLLLASPCVDILVSTGTQSLYLIIATHPSVYMSEAPGYFCTKLQNCKGKNFTELDCSETVVLI